MRAHLGRNTALIAALAAAGLAGCRATGVSETAAPTRPAGVSVRAARPCTTGLVTGVTGRIAFSSNRTGNYELFTINADGSGLTQLTNNPHYDDHPAWSPDGRKVAFTRSDLVQRDIYSMNADGTGEIQLTSDGSDDHEMAWSPDGTKIAFASDRTGNYEIFVMNADGSGPAQLTHTPTDDREPAWSPDGTKIAFSSGGIGYHAEEPKAGNYDIFVMHADGSEVRKLAGGEADDQNPAWSPDGTTVVWRIDRNGAGKLAAMNADGTGAAEIADDPDALSWPSWAPDGSPAWSPDGTKLVISSTRAAQADLLIMNANGCGAVNLTDDWAVDDEPAWQPTPPPTPAADRTPATTPVPLAPGPAELPKTT